MLRAGNVNWEDNPLNSIVFVTNNAPSGLQLLVTSNLTLLAAQSLTNDDATLLGLYPNLAIVPNSTIPSFTNLITTNLSAYYTNYPWDSAGAAPHLVFATNYSTNVMFVYTRAFANVVTNSFFTRGYVTVISTNLEFPPTGPVGYFKTNITTTTMLTNMVSGDYYIIPTTSWRRADPVEHTDHCSRHYQHADRGQHPDKFDQRQLPPRARLRQLVYQP